jgi:hypothetical protein
MCNNHPTSALAGKRIFGSVILVLMLGAVSPAEAQHVRDTISVIRDFNDVMAFTVQPYVYFSSTTSLITGPMRNGRDSVTRLHGKFYKCGEDMYYGTEAEELFVQDSLMIQIDHHRKAIMIRRIDMATKKNIDLLPLKKPDLQKLLRGHYLIGETPAGGDTAVISIRSQPGMVLMQGRSSEMRVEFIKDTHLPLIMEVIMGIRQDGSEQTRNLLKKQGFNVEKMKDSLNGARFFVMNETAAVRFDEVAMTREQAMQMPLWTERLAYDRTAGQFRGTGDCAGYAVTKTF